MKRYFDEDATHHLALVDEAHNLVDRSRDMYSSVINYETLMAAKKSLRHTKSLTMKRQLTKLSKVFMELMDGKEPGQYILDDIPAELEKAL